MIKSSFFIFVFLSQIFYAEAATDLRIRVLLSQENIQNLKITGQQIQIQEDVSFQKVSIPSDFQTILFQDYIKSRESYFWTYHTENGEKKKTNPMMWLQGHNLRINGKPIPDQIFLWPKNKKQVDVVAVLELDDYLQGVIPSEMPMQWPLEALKAQAVLARTYALFQMKNNSQKHYHLQSSVLDQKFTQKISMNFEERNKLYQVFHETRGLVLTDTKGVLIKPLYHADCGGSTVSANQVWGGPSDTVGVQDPFCQVKSKNKWSYSILKNELAKKLFLKGDILSVSIPSFLNLRAQNLVFKTTQETQSFSPQVVRSALGFMNVRSAILNIQKYDDEFVFSGSGFGHGVGLCQNGAKYMALSHKKYKEILNHYFPRYRLSTL